MASGDGAKQFWLERGDLDPIETLSFNPKLRQWHFNVQHRIQRKLETDRWAFPARQYLVTQTSRAGHLTGIPEFGLGLGLTIRPAATTGGGVPAPDASIEGEFQPSLDATQRLGANVLASLTVNTDFAETEVDTRRTNLTRFPLFFPEKRTFFLEGDDVFSFGTGCDIASRWARPRNAACTRRFTPEQMLEEYPLTLAQVHAALAYYYAHRDEVEGYIKEDQAWDEEYEREKAEFLSKRPPPSSR
ncbi:MAG: DUF433 domain-containing protein [Vicinamibacteria bacterium]